MILKMAIMRYDAVQLVCIKNDNDDDDTVQSVWIKNRCSSIALGFSSAPGGAWTQRGQGCPLCGMMVVLMMDVDDGDGDDDDDQIYIQSCF